MTGAHLRLGLAAALLLGVLPGALLGCSESAAGPVLPEGPLTWQELGGSADVDQQLQSALVAAKTAGQPVVVDFWASWCLPCKKLEKEVFPQPAVKKALARFVRIKFDTTTDSEAVQKVQARYSVTSMPTLLFFTPGGELLDDVRVTELVSAEALAAVLSSVPKT